jgi:hypothetical protein
LPSWWFSWKNCHFVGRFFDFVIILRPITTYQDYLNCPWPLSVRLQGKLLSSFNIPSFRIRCHRPAYNAKLAGTQNPLPKPCHRLIDQVN